MPSESARSPWWRWFVQVGLVAALAAVFYVLLLRQGGEEASDSWSSLGLRRLAGVLGLVLLGLGARVARWVYYTRVLDLKLPLGASVVAFLASFTFTASPGKVGEALKSLLLRHRFGTSVTSTGDILVAERTTDLLAVGAFALTGLGRLQGGGIGFVAAVALTVAAVAMVSSARLQAAILDPLAKVPFLTRPVSSIRDLLAKSRALLAFRHLGPGLLLALLGWSCECLALALILNALAPGATLVGDSFSIFGASTLLGVLSMLPGGLGSFEAAMIFLLQGIGVGRASAFQATLLIRLSTLWFVSLVGGVFLALWVILFRRRPRTGPDDLSPEARGSE